MKEGLLTKISPDQAATHLQPEIWHKVNRLHIKKIISEFAHELLIKPELEYVHDGWGHYQLPAGDQPILYKFKAKVLGLDHWYIDTDSIEKFVNNKSVPPDSLSFIIEFKDEIGFSSAILPAYMEEISSTLYGSAYMHSQSSPTSQELIDADYQQIEHAMMAGHPCFVANNGRIGFDAADYRNFAPEAALPLSLIWLAGHKDKTEFTCISGLNYQKVIGQELGNSSIEAFHNILLEKGLDPESYIFIPVHPWQWYNKLANVYAPDIASDYLVCLGYSEDKYLPQQSIRTFFNISNPEKFYVKTALSILNMGFMRGLSANFMRTTPAINEWVHAIVKKDSYLQEKGFTILRELATTGYTNQYFENALKSDSAYKKMLSSLWRESPLTKIKPGQRLMTMAALLHIDMNGSAFLPELIKASGLDTTSWLQRYLSCYLSPLLHCFYYHDMRFMPHGENLILVLENNIPVSAIMKDIGEEVAIINDKVILPDAVKRIAIPVPEELKILSIFTQIFDCFFRFMSHILVEHSDYPEDQFWELAADCILEYQQAYPELEEKFRNYDLFSSEIIKTCLNRLQIRDNQKLVDTSNPFKSQQFAGTLKNPLAVFKTSVI